MRQPDSVEGNSSAATRAQVSVPLKDDLTFDAKVSGVTVSCLLDTGSTINILHKFVFDVLTGVRLLKTTTQARTAAKDPLPLSGKVTVKFEMGSV